VATELVWNRIANALVPEVETILPDITKVVEEVHQAIVTGESTEDFFDTE
jgi:hypothetical protein